MYFGTRTLHQGYVPEHMHDQQLACCMFQQLHTRVSYHDEMHQLHITLYCVSYICTHSRTGYVREFKSTSYVCSQNQLLGPLMKVHTPVQQRSLLNSLLIAHNPRWAFTRATSSTRKCCLVGAVVHTSKQIHLALV